MKNKKGSVEVLVLVILVLVLVVSCLFIFSFSQTSTIKSFDLSSVHNTNSNRLVFEQSLYLAGEKAGVKTFYEFIQGQDYDYLKGRKNTGEFSVLHDKLKENFANRFKENFLEIFSSQTFFDKNLKYQYEMIKSGKFDVFFDGDNITINFNYVSTISHDESLNVEYSSSPSIKIPLNQIGVVGFNQLYFSKEKCKSISSPRDMSFCFENELSNFDVEVYKVKDSASFFGFISTDSISELNLVNLTSKSSFYLDKEINALEISFVPR